MCASTNYLGDVDSYHRYRANALLCSTKAAFILSSVGGRRELRMAIRDLPMRLAQSLSHTCHFLASTAFFVMNSTVHGTTLKFLDFLLATNFPFQCQACLGEVVEDLSILYLLHPLLLLTST